MNLTRSFDTEDGTEYDFDQQVRITLSLKEYNCWAHI